MNRHSRELEVLIEELLRFSINELDEKSAKKIYGIATKIVRLRKFFSM